METFTSFEWIRNFDNLGNFKMILSTFRTLYQLWYFLNFDNLSTLMIAQLWIFPWHPKSEKWVLPRTSSYISIGRVPEGHESFGTVWTSPWQNHFSDFGCQEKAFSEITVLNSKMLKMQILCCQKTREINAIQMDTTRR